MTFEQQHTTALEPSQAIHSPDAVRLQLPLAGPTSRILAYGIDLVLLEFVLLGIVLLGILGVPAIGGFSRWVLERLRSLVEPTSDPTAPNDLVAAVLAGLIVVQTFWEMIWFTCWEVLGSGATPGKRALHLRVMATGGRPLGVGASVIRNVLRAVDVLPSSYLVGLVSILVTPHRQRLGDLAAAAVVVRLDHAPAAAPLDARPQPVDRRFSFSRAQVARMGDVERALVRETLRRLESLEPRDAAQMLGRAVEALQERLGSDEELSPRDHEAFLRALWDAVRTS